VDAVGRDAAAWRAAAALPVRRGGDRTVGTREREGGGGNPVRVPPSGGGGWSVAEPPAVRNPCDGGDCDGAEGRRRTPVAAHPPALYSVALLSSIPAGLLAPAPPRPARRLTPRAPPRTAPRADPRAAPRAARRPTPLPTAPPPARGDMEGEAGVSQVATPPTRRGAGRIRTQAPVE